MTIPHHFVLGAGSPIYCLDWLAHDVLVYAGGGGKGKTGVSNYVRALHVPATARTPDDVAVLSEVKLSGEEDAPMCMAVDPIRTNTLVLGINDADTTKREDNQHLRIFSCEVTRDAQGKPSVTLAQLSKSPSLTFKDPAEAYLRHLSFGPSSRQLLSASTEGAYALHRYPSLEPAITATKDFEDEEIMDADFSEDGSQLVICSGKRLKVMGTFPNPAAESSDGSAELALPLVWHTIQNPALGGQGACEFRAVRFGRSIQLEAPSSKDVVPSSVKEGHGEGSDTPAGDEGASTSQTSTPSGSEGKLFTVVNAKVASGGGGRGKKGKRKSFLTSWHLPSCTLLLTRQLSEKPVTTFSISPSGSSLAYGSSDLSIGVVDAKSLRVVCRILDAHSFPPTAVAFSLPPPPSPSPAAETKSEKEAVPATSTTTESVSAVSPSSSPQYQWLASCSADGSIRLVRLSAGSSSSGWLVDLVRDQAGGARPLVLTLTMAMLILLLAIYLQGRLSA